MGQPLQFNLEALFPARWKHRQVDHLPGDPYGDLRVHLQLPPYNWTDRLHHPIKSRFNLMQAIDSSAHQQLLMIEEMAPALFTRHGLATLRDQIRSQDLSEADMYSWNSSSLYNAIRAFFSARSGTNNLNGTPNIDLHLDYDFWIRTGVRWLFVKRSKVSTWPEAVRAYNGAGQSAWRYGDAVMGRVGTTTPLTVGTD